MIQQILKLEGVKREKLITFILCTPQCLREGVVIFECRFLKQSIMQSLRIKIERCSVEQL
jgi:hypothetical protein